MAGSRSPHPPIELWTRAHAEEMLVGDDGVHQVSSKGAGFHLSAEGLRVARNGAVSPSMETANLARSGGCCPGPFVDRAPAARSPSGALHAHASRQEATEGSFR